MGQVKEEECHQIVFKAQNFVRAELENFDFDAKFNVTGATVYFSGAGFCNSGSVQTGTLTSGTV